MAYTLYTYYTGTYKGITIPTEAKFDYYIERSGDILDDRLNVIVSTAVTAYEDEVKKCNCAIADILYKEENGGYLASEKTLTYSVTYAKNNTKTVDGEITQILNRYLMKTGLLFGSLNDFIGQEVVCMYTSTKITLYNAYVNTTTRATDYHRTVLDSVHYETMRARAKVAQGSIGSDTVNISVPFTVSGGTYVEPKAFADLTTKTGYYTFNEEDTIVKGEIPDTVAFADLEATYDDCVVITDIDIADYGSVWMRHFELLCKQRGDLIEYKATEKQQ